MASHFDLLDKDDVHVALDGGDVISPEPELEPEPQLEPETETITEETITEEAITAGTITAGTIVRDACREVYEHMGPGYSEAVYQGALEIELSLRGIVYERQPVLGVYYKGKQVGYHKPDLVAYVDGQGVIVEMKATRNGYATQEQQLRRYIRHCHMAYGVLVNFGSSNLFVRVY